MSAQSLNWCTHFIFHIIKMHCSQHLTLCFLSVGVFMVYCLFSSIRAWFIFSFVRLSSIKVKRPNSPEMRVIAIKKFTILLEVTVPTKLKTIPKHSTIKNKNGKKLYLTWNLQKFCLSNRTTSFGRKISNGVRNLVNLIYLLLSKPKKYLPACGIYDAEDLISNQVCLLRDRLRIAFSTTVSFGLEMLIVLK